MPKQNERERFLRKVQRTDACWLWTAATAKGYGVFHVGGRQDGRSIAAHRYSYQMHVGPIPADLVLDHLCCNKRCVRPDHLEAVTQRTNLRRAWSSRTQRPGRPRIDRCRADLHDLDETNTYVRASGKRICRACRRTRQRAYRAERKETRCL